MAKQAYDHHKKAGNQGDVVKHVALIAALDTILKHSGNKAFKYADTFAGYAHNPLAKGNEWTQGIGKIAGQQELMDNQHTALYAAWYLSRPQMLGGMYPGSSLIAFDVCRWREKKAQMFLWDTSPLCFDDLRAIFHGQRNVTVFHAEASPQQAEVRLADFILIDPPNAKDDWRRVVEFLKSIRGWTMLWLPVHAAVSKGKVNEDSQSARCRNESAELGFTITKVRWAKGGRTIGCQLIYRLPKAAANALQRAVAHVSTIPEWETSNCGG